MRAEPILQWDQRPRGMGRMPAPLLAWVLTAL